MNLFCFVCIEILLGLPVYFHVSDPDVARRKTLVCCELVGTGPDCAWESRTVLMVDCFENGRYEVLVGHPPTEGNCGSATVMRSGEMSEDTRKDLWRMAEDYPYYDQGLGSMRNWVIATNSVMVLSNEAIEGIRFAVTNAVPNGTRETISGVHPLVWRIWGEPSPKEFYEDEVETPSKVRSPDMRGLGTVCPMKERKGE